MKFALGFLLCIFAWAVAVPTPEDTLERDVCIIGGGSSGTYAAIRLQQMGKKVALVERKHRLGGHVNTYVDPKTGQTYDYGVQIFPNISVVTDFFSHFNIPLAPVTSSGGGVSKNVNFETGTVVPDSELIGGNLTAALLKYAEQEAKYPTIFEKWDLPYPVPEDLLMNFGDFVKKYGLGAMTYTAFEYNQGFGNILAQPTLYVMKYQDQIITYDLLTGGFIYNAHSNNQQLYDRAEAELGSDVFLSSNVERIERSEDGVRVYFSNPDGAKCVKASKLVISIPPKLSNLGFLDLDSHDRGIFGQFNNSYYWDALVQRTGIPAGTRLNNVNPDAPYNLPALPGIYGFGATPIAGVYATYYSSPHPMTDADVKAEILSTLARLRKGLGYPEPEKSPEFVGFHNHSPFVLTVSTEAVKNGFYKQLEAIQGKSSTWWTGATWMNQATSTVWNFTEYHVLPHLLD